MKLFLENQRNSKLTHACGYTIDRETIPSAYFANFESDIESNHLHWLCKLVL